MATSGTVATTTLDTAVLIDHAVRRCGLASSSQTPETVEIAKQNLYLLLLNLANRGLNLWCVENELYGLSTAQREYALNPGTLRLLNVIYSQNSRVTGTDTVAANSVTTDLAVATKVVRYGFKPTASFTDAVTFSYSTDGVTFTIAQSLASQDWVGGSWYWFDLDPTLEYQYFQVASATNFTLDEFYLCNTYTDSTMTQFNRDEWTQQSNKFNAGRPSTNYYFDKTVSPTISLWPAPNNDYDVVNMWRHRFVQDVGSLTQQVEVPQQWMEAIVWQLAARLAYELPGVDQGRRTEVVQASERFLADAELSETDGAPIYMFSNVDVYTA